MRGILRVVSELDMESSLSPTTAVLGCTIVLLIVGFGKVRNRDREWITDVPLIRIADNPPFPYLGSAPAPFFASQSNPRPLPCEGLLVLYHSDRRCRQQDKDHSQPPQAIWASRTYRSKRSLLHVTFLGQGNLRPRHTVHESTLVCLYELSSRRHLLPP